MQIKNNEDYMAISIDELGLSTRTFNCLMRAGLNTLYLLVDNYETLPKLRNMGAKSITEIDELLARIAQDGISVIPGGEAQSTGTASETEPIEQAASLPEGILSRPASDLHISIRILHSFQNEGIETIAQALALTPEAIRHMRNMGTLSAQQLQEQLELLKEMGEAYFAANAAADDDSAVPAYDKREMDVETAKLLQENYGLKTAWLWKYITTRSTKERTYVRYVNGQRIKHTVKPVLGEKAAHNNTVVYSMDFQVTPHQLRHTYITNLIYAAVDPKTVQYLAGHENSKITMDIYAKVKYNRPQELAAVVNSAFNKG